MQTCKQMELIRTFHFQTLSSVTLISKLYTIFLNQQAVMKRYLLHIMLLFSLLALSNCVNSIPLQIAEIQTISLKVGTTVSYKITVPSNISTNEDLYIHVKPSIADPLQVPYLTVTSDEKYKQNCYNAHESFAGICKIDAKQLIEDREFILTIKCVTDCTLELETYLSDIITLFVGQELQLNSYTATGLTVVVLVKVPSIVTYSALALIATITNIQRNAHTVEEKFDMLINYGDENVQAPTDEKFMVAAYSIFTGGRGAYLSHDDVKPGNWIKVYLRLEMGISITFSVSQISDGNTAITLGTSYFDYTSAGQQKMYILNISEQVEQLKNRTIELVFDIYSGDPSISIGFDSQFSNEVPFVRKASATSYALSPTIRTDYNFNDSIFIKVSATLASEYYFYTKVNREDATYMHPYLTYFDELDENQVENFIMVERFAYEQGKEDTIRDYTFKVQIFSGQGKFFLRRCQNIEKKDSNKQNLTACLVHNAEGVKDPNFLKNELQNKFIINGDKLVIQMEHDIRNCNELGKRNNLTYKQCGFQIVAVGQTQQPFAFSITAERRFYSTYLKQNFITNDYIYKDSYVFYAFSLPSLQGVTEIDFFVTTFSGQSALIVSSSEQFPTLDSKATDVQISTGEQTSVTISGQNLASHLFISVYGYQFTEVNLQVLVRRQFNSTDTSSNVSDTSMNLIQLSKGSVITYSMNNSKQAVSFRFNSLQDESVVISLNQLVGPTTFKLFDIFNSPLPCIGKIDNPSICQIVTIPNTEYRIQVRGQLGTTNKFTISYKNSIDSCTTVPLNIPTKVILHSSETECYDFPINRNIDLKLVASFNHVQLLNRQIDVEIYINKGNRKSIMGTHDIITSQAMSKVCPLNSKKPGFAKTCLVSIKFVSLSQNTQVFSFILEEDDAQIALFDGIVEKVHDLDVSLGGGKLFYYFLYNTLPIKIFFDTVSIKYNFMLIAKLLNNEQFLQRKRQGGLSLWADFTDQFKQNLQNQNSNIFIANVSNQQTSAVVVGQEYIDDFCIMENGCYLLITIAATAKQKSSTSHLSKISYELQASQEEVYLALGETKIGFVEQTAVYSYLIDPADAIVEISNLNGQSKLSSKCASLYVLDLDGHLRDSNQVGGGLQLKKTDQIRRIFVFGNLDQCSYQISYTSIDQPIKTVRLSTPYQLSLEPYETQGFLFYNPHPTSFRILTLLSGGIADIYILPFNENNLTLKMAIQMNYTYFPLVDEMQGDFVISSKNEYFCSECFYYIVITTKSKFIGEVIFLRITDPIPLTVRHVFTQKMSPQTEFDRESYVLYSLNSFNIMFSIMYGSIEVTITNPLKKQVVHQKISATKTFSVQAVDYKIKQKIEFFSSKAMYSIKVKALAQTIFMVKVDHVGATERIFEGFPTTIRLVEGVKTTIQFVNGQQYQKPLTLMADILQLSGKEIILNLGIVAHLDNGKELNQSTLFRSLVKSDNTYICSLNNIQGTYFITVQTSISANVTFLLFKNTLTHISPSSNHLFDSEGIFELPSNDKNVMVQIFNCKGDLSVTASEDYQYITDPSVANSSLITLKRPNYGGHYVFGVQNMHQASYFLKILNKNKANGLQYLINYYYYDGINPYDSIDALNYDIISKITDNGLIVDVMPPELSDSLNNSISIKNISYWAYASNTRYDLNRGSRCSIEGNVIKSFSSDNSGISINKQLLGTLFDENNGGTLYVTVEASIQVQITSNLSNQHYPSVLTILYNTIELQQKGSSILQYKYWFTDNLLIFLGWMLLPFLLAGITLYYVIKICFRVLLGRQRNMVEQIEVGGSSVSTDAQIKGAQLGQCDTGDMNLKAIDI